MRIGGRAHARRSPRCRRARALVAIGVPLAWRRAAASCWRRAVGEIGRDGGRARRRRRGAPSRRSAEGAGARRWRRGAPSLADARVERRRRGRRRRSCVVAAAARTAAVTRRSRCRRRADPRRRPEGSRGAGVAHDMPCGGTAGGAPRGRGGARVCPRPPSPGARDHRGELAAASGCTAQSMVAGGVTPRYDDESASANACGGGSKRRASA